MNFIQKTEIYKPNLVILYLPFPNFSWPNLHPRAALYNSYSNVHLVIKNITDAKNLLEKEGIEVYTINDVLKKNRENLLKFAMKSVTYQLKELLKFKTEVQKHELEFALSDKYKEETLSHFTDDELVETIMHNPICNIEPDSINTGLILSTIEIDPLANMIFCRDQQIITQKGIVLSNLNSKQREREKDIIEFFYEQLGVKILGEVSNNSKLEGGDFMTIKEDLSLLGISLRTNFESAVYLMENDFLGTKRFAVVVDENDLNQKRMHLDSFFNILNSEEVLLLDMSTIVPKPLDSNGVELNLRRTVHLFEKKEGKQIFGNYDLVKKIDFEEFLKEEGFRIIKVTHEQQSAFIISFLNIGNNEIITPNKLLKDFLKENNSKTNVTYLEFDEVLKMYGGFHSITQAIRF